MRACVRVCVCVCGGGGVTDCILCEKKRSMCNRSEDQLSWIDDDTSLIFLFTGNSFPMGHKLQDLSQPRRTI